MFQGIPCRLSVVHLLFVSDVKKEKNAIIIFFFFLGGKNMGITREKEQ